jgi:hypothetical protein
MLLTATCSGRRVGDRAIVRWVRDAFGDGRASDATSGLDEQRQSAIPTREPAPGVRAGVPVSMGSATAPTARRGAHSAGEG